MKESIAAGGSYLVDGIQSTGISFGLERISSLAKIETEKIKAIIISISQEKQAISVAENLRKKDISCFILDKISKGLDYANKEKIPFVIFVGKEEISKKKLKLRDMSSGKEKMLKIEEIVKIISSK